MDIPTFTVIDKETGREVSAEVIQQIAKNGNLMDMDIEQFAITESGSLLLLDDCGNFTYCVQDAFEIKVESEDKQIKMAKMGEVTDGYHTFNQLYHQRAILFATIVNQNTNIAWKSYKHSDGKYCFDSNGEWFVVGVDTPEGSYTYHYSKEYWDYFKCKELDCGKEWDGHTEEDVTRLLSLDQKSCDDAISKQAVLAYIDKMPSELTADGRRMIRKRTLEEYISDTLPSITPEPKIGHCKGCKYFEYDSVAKVDGIPLIVAHEICSKWGDGCKTKEDGYCFLFEPQEGANE